MTPSPASIKAFRSNRRNSGSRTRRYASIQEAAEAVKEASYSTADITSIRTIVGKKLNEIPANSKRARCYLGFLWTDDESVSRKDETRDARTAIAEFGEGCWILHEFNGAKWQYFENTSAAAEEVKEVSGYHAKGGLMGESEERGQGGFNGRERGARRFPRGV